MGRKRRKQHKERTQISQSPADSAPPPRERTNYAIGLVLLAGMVAYFNSLEGVFVFDSIYSIRDNPHIRTLWPLSEAMSLPLINGDASVSRRPLLSLSFALNQYLLGPEPWGYHVGNLSIHLAAGLLLFGILRRTLNTDPFRATYGGRAEGLAMVVALIWVVHPLQTESVTYLAQRAESLMGTLYLLTLYCAMRGFHSRQPTGWYVASVVACGTGMGVKEIMITAPVLVYLYDGVFVSRSYRSAWQERWRFYLSLAATWLIFGGLIILGLAEASKDFTDRSPLQYALTQPGVILHYLRLSVWPDTLLINYHWPNAASFAQIVPAGSLLLSLLVATAWGMVRRKWFGYLGAWFFLVLGPSSSFVALSQNAAEHRMYLSLAAVVVLLVLTADKLLSRLSAGTEFRRRRFLGSLLVLVVVVLLTGRTVMRNYQYYSGIGLWTDVIENQPNNASAYFNLGLEYATQDKFEEAARQFEQALRINPNYVDSLTNLGSVLQRQGNFEQAIVCYDRALKIQPDSHDLNFNLGTLYLTQNKPQQAEHYLLEALRLQPGSHQAHHNLGQLLADQGDLEGALQHFETAYGLAELEITRENIEQIRAQLGRD